jgi:hypothetical protein
LPFVVTVANDLEPKAEPAIRNPEFRVTRGNYDVIRHSVGQGYSACHLKKGKNDAFSNSGNPARR